jgi:hypothetical protein
MSARSLLSEASNGKTTARGGDSSKTNSKRELPPTLSLNPDMSVEYRVSCAASLVTTDRGFYELVRHQQ